VFGLYFALRGRDEHRTLRYSPSQISLKFTSDGRRYLEYRQDVSKTNCGGLHTVKSEPKITQAFELKESVERCPVRLYLLYNSLCPVDRPAHAFYLRPLVKYTKTQWYSTAAVGVNTLSSVVTNLPQSGLCWFFYKSFSEGNGSYSDV